MGSPGTRFTPSPRACRGMPDNTSRRSSQCGELGCAGRLAARHRFGSGDPCATIDNRLLARARASLHLRPRLVLPPGRRGRPGHFLSLFGSHLCEPGFRAGLAERDRRRVSSLLPLSYAKRSVTTIQLAYPNRSKRSATPVSRISNPTAPRQTGCWRSGSTPILSIVRILRAPLGKERFVGVWSAI